MSKVEQGILINNQHIQNVLNNKKDEKSFSQSILELGYETLEEFFEEKREYEMQKVLKGTVIDVAPKDAMSTFASFLQNNTYAIASVDTNETCVHHGQDTSKYLNEQYCIDNNIAIYPYDTFGGNIVAAKGDYTIILSVPIETDVSTRFFLHHFKKILDKYFDDITIEGNDLLYKNKKIAGTTNFTNSKSYSMSITFSMTNKDELIQNICGEPNTGKLPGYLDSNILSTAQLKEEVLTWLQGL